MSNQTTKKIEAPQESEKDQPAVKAAQAEESQHREASEEPSPPQYDHFMRIIRR